MSSLNFGFKSNYVFEHHSAVLWTRGIERTAKMKARHNSEQFMLGFVDRTNNKGVAISDRDRYQDWLASHVIQIGEMQLGHRLSLHAVKQNPWLMQVSL